MQGKRLAIALLWAVGAAVTLAGEVAWAGELTGSVSLETRYFPQDPVSEEQYSGLNFSLAIEPEYAVDWANGDQRLVIAPFIRLDQNDRRRTHFDIRELYWERYTPSWELRVGLRRVFWGVIESNHPVDVINQFDFVENIDFEDKLGQPMVEVAIKQDWGVIKGFVMPYFRERTFPGRRGRLRTVPRVDTDQARYESGAKETHMDWAARYSHYIGPVDFGVAHFSGTARQPVFMIGMGEGGDPVLIPNYVQSDQTSLDLQATLGGWLWKVEAKTVAMLDDRFNAVAGGFEYTFIGIFGRAYDLGVLSEYHYDDRDSGNIATPYDNDLFGGLRFVLNDEQSTEVLGGVIADLDRSTRLGFVEFSRRVGNRWRVEAEMRTFADVGADDIVYSFRKDSFLQLTVARYF